MESPQFPKEIPNWVGQSERAAVSGEVFDKINPHNGQLLCRVSRSRESDVRSAIQVAREAQPSWGARTAVSRGETLHEIAMAMRKRRQEIAAVVALETGKSFSAALAETDGAVSLGLFMAGEGRRLFGRTTTSGVSNKFVATVREPLGVAGLIVAANTPIANVAWKVFPALICGNSAVLKAAEDTPITAWIFAKIAYEAGLDVAVLSVINGYGEEAGAPLVASPAVDVISFTGSTAVGREIAVIAGKRLAKLSLELGGKNPFVVCEDADLPNATEWAVLSAFSNAGQRCASGSRIIVFEAVYDQFLKMLIERTQSLRVGPADKDDFGPVINLEQLNNMLATVERARKNGAKILTGGSRLTDEDHRNGFYMAPTLIADVRSDDEISQCELFGPITCIYKARDFDAALTMANDSPYGLTACIHTKNLHRAIQFTRDVQAGVAVVNAGTFGSEPHMPFGGVKQSGNGSREPGPEALDVYSTLKSVYISIDPKQV